MPEPPLLILASLLGLDLPLQPADLHGSTALFNPQLTGMV